MRECRYGFECKARCNAVFQARSHNELDRLFSGMQHSCLTVSRHDDDAVIILLSLLSKVVLLAKMVEMGP